MTPGSPPNLRGELTRKSKVSFLSQELYLNSAKSLLPLKVGFMKKTEILLVTDLPTKPQKNSRVHPEGRGKDSRKRTRWDEMQEGMSPTKEQPVKKWVFNWLDGRISLRQEHNFKETVQDFFPTSPVRIPGSTVNEVYNNPHIFRTQGQNLAHEHA